MYKVGLDGLIAGLGMWTHHAQAQVKVDGTWKWVSNGLQDNPDYTIDGEIYYWQPDIYEMFLKQNNALR